MVEEVVVEGGEASTEALDYSEAHCDEGHQGGEGAVMQSDARSSRCRGGVGGVSIGGCDHGGVHRAGGGVVGRCCIVLREHLLEEKWRKQMFFLQL